MRTTKTTATTAFAFVAAVAIILALAIADQVTKAAVRSSVAPSESVRVLGFLKIVNVTNTGTAFGLFRGAAPYLVALSAVVITAILLARKHLNFSRRIQQAALILILAGLVSNTLDRALFRAVTDFIYIAPWPAFNFADGFLFAGAALLLASLIIPKAAQKKFRLSTKFI